MMGHKLGIIASGDSHNGHPGRYGIMAVYSTNLDRQNIFKAIKDRMVYGSTGARIILKFEINGNRMGSEFVTNEYPKIYVNVIGASNIEKIEIIKHTKDVNEYPIPVVYVNTPNAKIRKVNWTDNKFTNDSFYYVRVTQDDGEIAWSSPIWVKKE